MSISLPKTYGLSAGHVFQSLEQGLSAGGLAVMASDEVTGRLDRHGNLHGCESTDCIQEIGRILGVPLVAQVAGGRSGGGVRLTVVLTWTHNGKPVARMGRQCRGQCPADRLKELIANLAKAAGRRALDAYRANPPPRARTRPGNNGKHAGNGSAAGKDRGRPYWITGIALVCVGVAATATGVTFLALDGIDKPGRDTSTEYRYILDSKVGGAIATAIGAATIATGIGLLIHGLLQKKRGLPSVVLTVDPRRGRAMLTGRIEF